MAVVLAVLVGFLTARLLWLALRRVLTARALLRTNYRGRTVVTAAGLVLPLVAVVVEGARALIAATGLGAPAGSGTGRVLVLLAALGFGLLGFIDDLLGDAGVQGFRGHGTALLRGELTTGGLKLVGGAVVALAVVAAANRGSGWHIAVDAALVALSANLANLLDRRPGRLVKSTTLAFLVLVAATWMAHPLIGVAVVVGASLGLLIDDLHEHLMLGDVGANVLGGVLGLGVVLSCSAGVRLGVLVLVGALNVLSEVVSFSGVIEAVPPLRALDALGRLR